MLDSIAVRFQKYAPVFLRAGLAIVFVLFGLQKLTNPSQTTAEIQLLLSFELANAAALNYYLGLLEIFVALALAIGFKIRFFALVAAFLTAMFLLSFFVKYGVSINPDLYRDAGLVTAAIALFLLGAGPLTLGAFLSSRKTQPQESSKPKEEMKNNKERKDV